MMGGKAPETCRATHKRQVINMWNSFILLVDLFECLNSFNFFIFLFFLWRCDPTRVMASSFLRFLDHTQRRTTVGRTPLDEWSARRRDLYLITHDTHNRQTSMPPAGFEPTISAGKRPQTYALDRTATGTSPYIGYTVQNCYYLSKI